jgi:hypothetical protein
MPSKSKEQVYVAKDSGHAEVEGVPYTFHKGITRVRGGHPLTKIKGFENIFEPVDDAVHYDVEQATKAPGEKRGVTADPAPGERPTSSGVTAAQAAKQGADVDK